MKRDHVDLTLDDEDVANAAPPSKVTRRGDTLHVDYREEKVLDEPHGDADAGDAELVVTGVSGSDWQDLAHPRHLCRAHPLQLQHSQGHANAASCMNCWCYVCDVKAEECTQWCCGVGADNHCNARETPEWRTKKLAARTRARVATEMAVIRQGQELPRASPQARRVEADLAAERQARVLTMSARTDEILLARWPNFLEQARVQRQLTLRAEEQLQERVERRAVEEAAKPQGTAAGVIAAGMAMIAARPTEGDRAASSNARVRALIAGYDANIAGAAPATTAAARASFEAIAEIFRADRARLDARNAASANAASEAGMATGASGASAAGGAGGAQQGGRGRAETGGAGVGSAFAEIAEILHARLDARNAATANATSAAGAATGASGAFAAGVADDVHPKTFAVFGPAGTRVAPDAPMKRVKEAEGGRESEAEDGGDNRGISGGNSSDRGVPPHCFPPPPRPPPPRPSCPGPTAGGGGDYNRGISGGNSSDRGVPTTSGARAAPVCYAFQKGECTRGDACRFAHGEGGGGGGGGGFGGGGGGGAPVCYAFQKSECMRGYGCYFSHDGGSGGGGGGAPQRASGPCYAFQKGECTRGDGCRFSHDPNAAYGGNHKASRTCYAFERGMCRRGDACRFSHE